MQHSRPVLAPAVVLAIGLTLTIVVAWSAGYEAAGRADAAAKVFVSASPVARVLILLGAGFVVSCLFAGLTLREARARARAERMTAQLAALDDALARANRAKDEFLAMLGHELRNPLGALSNALKVVRMRGISDPTALRAIDVAERQVRHQARLVDDLLDLTRLVEGKVPLQLTPLDLNDVCQRAVATTRPAADKRTQSLELHTTPMPLVVEGDATRLEQIVMNLTANAIRSTPPGGSIEVSLEEDDVRGEAVVRIRDEGIGIEASELEQVFKPFFQGTNQRGRAEGGLGIGLTIVQRLVTLHRGSVEARSEGRGRGAEFIVRLPRADGGPAEMPSTRPSMAPRPPPSLPESAQGSKVLIVEDVADSRCMLRDLLELLGLQVEEADCGVRGVERALSVKPDIAIVDIGLPDIDGLEVARRIRERNSRSIRLIALTGYGLPDDVRRSIEAGFDAHLVKPLDVEHLVRVVAELLEEKEPLERRAS